VVAELAERLDICEKQKEKLLPDNWVRVFKSDRSAEKAPPPPSKWPKRTGAGRPNISARNKADFVWSDDQTIVWFSCAATLFTSIDCAQRAS
jgi:hypothetical protein